MSHACRAAPWTSFFRAVAQVHRLDARIASSTIASISHLTAPNQRRYLHRSAPLNLDEESTHPDISYEGPVPVEGLSAKARFRAFKKAKSAKISDGKKLADYLNEVKIVTAELASQRRTAYPLQQKSPSSNLEGGGRSTTEDIEISSVDALIEASGAKSARKLPSPTEIRNDSNIKSVRETPSFRKRREERSVGEVIKASSARSVRREGKAERRRERSSLEAPRETPSRGKKRRAEKAKEMMKASSLEPVRGDQNAEGREAIREASNVGKRRKAPEAKKIRNAPSTGAVRQAPSVKALTRKAGKGGEHLTPEAVSESPYNGEGRGCSDVEHGLNTSKFEGAQEYFSAGPVQGDRKADETNDGISVAALEGARKVKAMTGNPDVKAAEDDSNAQARIASVMVDHPGAETKRQLSSTETGRETSSSKFARGGREAKAVRTISRAKAQKQDCGVESAKEEPSSVIVSRKDRKVEEVEETGAKARKEDGRIKETKKICSTKAAREESIAEATREQSGAKPVRADRGASSTRKPGPLKKPSKNWASKENRNKSTTGRRVFRKNDKSAGRNAPEGGNEAWRAQKAALKEKFPEGWRPRKRLSPDALAGIRALHAQFPDIYTTAALADKFKVSPEAIRRILRSKWEPTVEEEEDRQERWFQRGMKVWEKKAELGIKPPQRWRREGIVRQPEYHERRRRRQQQEAEWEAEEIRKYQKFRASLRAGGSG